MKLKGGRGHRESAAAWRLRQQLAALAAACAEAPSEGFPALAAVRELRPVFGSLCGRVGSLDSDSSSSSSTGSDGSSKDRGDGQCPQLLQEAAVHIRGAVARLGGGQLTVSLLHAHLFLAWDALQPGFGGGSSGGGCAADGSDEEWPAEGEAGAEACAAWAGRDFLGPAARWRVSSAQYGGLVHALGWEALLLDALLWLPRGGARGTPRPAQLLAALAAAAPAAAASTMRLLAAAPPGDEGGGAVPCQWWRVLLHSLPRGPVSGQVAQPSERFALLSQLADAAAWGLADALAAGSGGPEADTAAASLLLLEQLLGDWQEDLAAAARTSGAHAAAMAALAARLEALQPQLQARVVAAARTDSGNGDSGTAAATLSGPALIHANTRIMLCLMAWRQGPLTTDAAAAVPGGDGVSSGSSGKGSSGALWKALLQQPAQPEAVWPGSCPPWAELLPSGEADSEAAADTPQCPSGAGGGHGGWAGSGGTGANRSALVASIISAQCRSAAAGAEAGPIGVPPHPASGAPLLQLPGAARAGDPDSAAQHCLALACAWLTPGALCWWPLPCAPALQAAAGANPFAPGQLLAALLEMLAHVGACEAAGTNSGVAAPAFDPATRQLLTALAVGIGSHVESPEQQGALLAAAFPAPGSGAACDVALRLAVAREQLAASDPAFRQSAEAALIAVSNRLIVRDAAQEGVVPSAEQQARAAAEAARALLLHTLLWPDAVLQRLLLDGVKHSAQQPVIVQLLGALAPLCLHAPAANAPSRLLRQLRGTLQAGSSGGKAAAARSASDAERTAARGLVERLLDARLIDGGQAAFQLAMVPLAQLWESWRGDGVGAAGGPATRGSGAGDGIRGRPRLRGLLEVAEPLLLRHAEAGPGGGAHRWAAALGLCAAAELLRGPRGSSASASEAGSTDPRVAPDYAGVAQAERTLAALVSAAAGSPAAAGGGDGAAAAAADELVALPFERRLALLPLVEAAAAAGGDGAPDWRRAEALLRPQIPTRPGGSGSTGPGEAVGVMRLALAFAASADEHVRLLSACLGRSDPAHGSCGGGLAVEIAAELASAVAQLPGTALRPALLLAVAELLPFATETAARRVLTTALPAVLSGRAAPATPRGHARQEQPEAEQPAADSAGWVASAAVQITCRAVFVFLAHSRWARCAAATARQQVAEQLFRHVSALALHELQRATASAAEEPAGPGAGAARQQELQRRQQRARLRAAQLCMAECCDLLASLQGRVEGGAAALQPLLLRLTSEIAQPDIVAAERCTAAAPSEGEPDSGGAAATFGSAGAGAGAAQRSGALGVQALADAEVACTGEPFEELLAWAAAQLARLPCTQQLLPALAHMAATAAASAAHGPGSQAAACVLREQAEAAVEAAAAAATAAAASVHD